MFQVIGSSNAKYPKWVKKLRLYNFDKNTFKHEFQNLDVININSENDIINDVYNNIENYYNHFLVFKNKKLYLRDLFDEQEDEININEIKNYFDSTIISNKNKIVEIIIDENVDSKEIYKENEDTIYVKINSYFDIFNLNIIGNNRAKAVWLKDGNKYLVYKVGPYKPDNFKLIDKKILIVSKKQYEDLN